MIKLPGTRRGRLILGAVATLLLGALGSGLWQYVFEPAVLGIRNVLLNVASLGVETFKEQLYREVAKHAFERVALQVLTHTLLLFVALQCALAAWAFHVRARVRSQRQELLDRVDDSLAKLDQPESPEPGESPESGDRQPREALELREEILAVRTGIVKDLSDRRLSVPVYSMFLLVLLMLTSSWVGVIRVRYIHGAQTYLDQLSTLAAPVMDSSQEELLRARVAAIQGREDYVAIVDGLVSAISARDVPVPSFSIW